MPLLHAWAASHCWLALVGSLMPGAVAAAGSDATRDDQAEFERLLSPVLSAAYGAALHMTRNRADAEDLVQEASLLAYRGFQQFERGTNFKAWFFRILTNSFYSTYRKRRRQGTQVELEDVPELYLYARTALPGAPSEAADPAATLLAKLDTEAAQAAIEMLPEEYRVVASLYFMQDFSYQEIAEVCGCPVGTVRSRLHRGRRLLQRALWRIAEERGIATRGPAGGAADDDNED
jgi:RNA polymerase sigma-70 factor (ECF subfamily)